MVKRIKVTFFDKKRKKNTFIKSRKESDKQIYNSIGKSISKEEKDKKATRRQGLIIVGVILFFIILSLIPKTEIFFVKETDECKGFTISIENEIVPIKCYADYILLYDKYKFNYSDLGLKGKRWDVIIIKFKP